MDHPRTAIIESWPEMPLNRADTELQIFSKYFGIIDKKAVETQMFDNFGQLQIKNKNQSDHFRKLGNDFYTELEYSQAMAMYNTSIWRAPRNSVEFALAVANRSAVFFDLEKYQDCLRDINMILKSEYPKDLKYKIYLRQGRCYLKLKLNFEAAKSIRKAQESANKYNNDKLIISSINDKITEIKSLLKDQLLAEAPNSESNDNVILAEPSLKDGENLKFINASKVVDFRYTKKLGRHVVANTEIKKGDVLFIEKPYAFAALNRNRAAVHFNVCAFCFERTFHCVPCMFCEPYFYCSDKCRQTAWDLSHRWDCVGQRLDILSNGNEDELLCLSVLFQASRDGFQSAVQDDSVYGNKENNYPFLNKLLTHKNKVSKEDFTLIVKNAVWLVLYLEYYTDYFKSLYIHPNRPEGSEDELFNFVGGELVKYLLQIKCNAVAIREGVLHFNSVHHIILSYVGVGFGIFLSTSLLNHSCLSNTVHSFHGSTRVVKASEDIRKNTEITINYSVKSYYLRGKIERKIELGRFLFTCSCRACTDSSFEMLSRPFLCIQCNGKAYQVEEEMFAKCIECHLIFDATQHFINNNIIAELMTEYDIFYDQIQLNELFKLMKETFHKDNTNYSPYYLAKLHHYEKTGEIKKCVDIEKTLLEISKNSYGEISKRYVCAVMNFTYYSAKYYRTLSKQNSETYRKLFDEIKELILKSTDLLQYFTCTAHVKKYVTDITKYLNSDSNLVMDVNLQDCE